MVFVPAGSNCVITGGKNMMETQNQRDENKKRSLECISRINEVEGFSPESLKEDMMVGDTVKPMLSL